MNFNDLAWAALLHHYKSGGDKKYVKLFRDTAFITKLRETPWDVPYEEFEVKVLTGFLNSIGLRRPVGTKGGNILTEIIKLHSYTSSLQGTSLHNCDLSDKNVLRNIKHIYNGLSTINGLWITGLSKIAHVLNDALFVAYDPKTSKHLGLRSKADDYTKWLGIVQQHAVEATADFTTLGFPGSPEAFLSEKLGDTNYGCEKSLARFIDEYFWLTTSENLSIPPIWAPQYHENRPV